jgi:hypothetical protein
MEKFFTVSLEAANGINPTLERGLYGEHLQCTEEVGQDAFTQGARGHATTYIPRNEDSA